MFETDQPANTSFFLGQLCGISSSCIKTSASFRHYCQTLVTAVVLASVFTTNASADSVIYALGDSITRGKTHIFDSDDYPLSAYRNRSGFPSNIRSYREHAHDALIAPGCGADITWVGASAENNRTPVHHDGRSGFRVDQILNKTWQDDQGRFTASNIDGWLSTLQPDVVLIHLGTNDIAEGEDAVSTADEIDELVSRIYRQQPSATILLANLIPIHGWWAAHVKLAPFSFRDIAGEVSSLAGLIGNIVSSRQANGEDIHLVDVNSGFFVDEANLTVCGGSAGDPHNMSATSCTQAPDGSGLVPDGVHPNLIGEAFIGRQFADVLINEVGICQGSDDALPAVPDDSPMDPSDNFPTPDAAILAPSLDTNSPASNDALFNSSTSSSAVEPDTVAEPETAGAAKDTTIYVGAFVEFYGVLIAFAIAAVRRQRRRFPHFIQRQNRIKVSRKRQQVSLI